MLDDGEVEKLATGFQFTECPVWDTSEGCLLFSDIPENRIYRWAHGEPAKTFREPSGNSNWLTFDWGGSLITCEHGTRRLGKVERGGAYTVLVDRY